MSARALIAVAVFGVVCGCSADQATISTTGAITTTEQDTTTAPVVPSTTTAGPSSTSTTSVSTTKPEISWDEEAGAFFEQLAAGEEFSGVILIGHDEEIIWQQASGLANRDENRPNQVDTKFNLGSMNKMFTAVAVLQLMEQGELNLDDTIAQVLSDYPSREVADVVTIHHLLTHTAGLGDTFTPVFAADPNRYRSNADYLPLFVDEPLLFDPGESFAYSNAGYVVLGLIIEEASGQDYYEYVRRNIFETAGMTDTDSFSLDEDVANLAMGYTTRDFNGNDTGVLSANSPLMPGRGFAAGGGYSTIEDLFRFRNALLGHELLTPASTALLFEAQAELAPGFEYGYGFMVREDEGSLGHSGGAPGICSFFSMYPGSGYTIIVLSNSDDGCLAVLRYVQDNPPS